MLTFVVWSGLTVIYTPLCLNGVRRQRQDKDAPLGFCNRLFWASDGVFPLACLGTALAFFVDVPPQVEYLWGKFCRTTLLGGQCLLEKR